MECVISNKVKVKTVNVNTVLDFRSKMGTNKFLDKTLLESSLEM